MRAKTSPTECWHCRAGVTAARLEVEAMIHSRREQDGGPYHSFRCAPCGTTNGALRNRHGAWLLYPLEGADEPSLIDWISPRFSRQSLRAAVEWWARNGARVSRFRLGSRRAEDAKRAAPKTSRQPPPRTRKKPKPPPPPKPPPAPPPPEPRPPPPRPKPPPPAPRAPPAQRAPRELLGIDGDASVEDVKSAYRRALKLCHPDRVANLDPEIQDLAHRKAKALRRAYESLLRELAD